MRKIKLIEFDETFCLLGFENKVKRFYGVYFFDPNQKTHLCEWPASYFLAYLYFNFERLDHIPEDENEAIYTELEDACSGDYNDTYMHVSDVEEILKAGEIRTTEIEFDDDATDDDVREYLRGNHLL
jgi:hypothetical protein